MAEKEEAAVAELCRGDEWCLIGIWILSDGSMIGSNDFNGLLANMRLEIRAEDKLIWKPDNKANFSVKYYYNLN